MSSNQAGIVYTFYSFKGGVGRSMAVANVAALLAQKGNRVLMIDWDLEAPGLEKYFTDEPSHISCSRAETTGIIDIIDDFSNGIEHDWRDCLIYGYPFPEGKPVCMLTAGKDNADYFTRLQKIDWNKLFNENKLAHYLEKLRKEWINEYDYVLIDSRTGITDIGGICTILLPDILVFLFTANYQSVDGIADIMSRATSKHKALPLDRSKLIAIPIPSRFEYNTEYELSSKWKSIFAYRLEHIYKDWIPDNITAADILEKLVIPYVPYWSFGERLPVIKEGTSDPKSIGFVYDLLARLLSNRLDWKKAMEGDIVISAALPPEKQNALADGIYEAFTDADKKTVQSIFRKLVYIERNLSAKKIAENEFTEKEKEIVKKLCISKLLFRSKDEETGELIIEISNPALLKNWKKLASWFENDKEFFYWREKLNSYKQSWLHNNEEKIYLLKGESFESATLWLNKSAEDLTISEERFIITSQQEKKKRRKKINALLVGLFAFVISFIAVYTVISENGKSRQATINLRHFKDSLAILTRLTDSALHNATCSLSLYDNKYNDPFIDSTRDSLAMICSLYHIIETNERAINKASSDILSLSADSSKKINTLITQINEKEKDLNNNTFRLNLIRDKPHTNADSVLIKKLIDDSTRLAKQRDSLLASNFIFQQIDTANKSLNTAQKQIDSIGNSRNARGNSEQAWFKEGYFLKFDNIKVILQGIDKRKNQIQVKVSDINELNMPKEYTDIFDITTTRPATFTLNGLSYTLSLDRIGRAGKNPFTPAAYITFTKK